MAIKYPYDESYVDKGWFDAVLTPSGWFDNGFSEDAGAPPSAGRGKIKVGGVFVDLLARKFKVGGTFVDATGYKVKISGTFVDLV